jgi:hypothetical protein
MYFPKSQITSNLYTNGNEFILSTTQEIYIGFYFKTSTGKIFTGKTPDDRPNIELIPLISNENILAPLDNNFQSNYSTTANIFEQSNEIYLDIKSEIPLVKFIPTYSPTLPTSQDYQNGEFQRYFCKKTNEIKYIEINKEQFDKLVAQDPQIEFSLYQPFTITWIISGDKDIVAKTNRNIVELASFRQKLPRLADYLRFDYTKYLK